MYSGTLILESLKVGTELPDLHLAVRKIQRTAVEGNRVFRYRRGDDAAREQAQEFGRNLSIPEAQLDWAR
jgi:hypothetical protein